MAAQRQTVAKGDGIPAEKSTTTALIIKRENIVQYVEKDIHDFHLPNHIITAALNIAAVLH